MCVCSLSYPESQAPTSYYIVICGLSGSTIYSTLTARFAGKKLFNKTHVF